MFRWLILFKGVFIRERPSGFYKLRWLVLSGISVYKCELYALSLKLCYKTDDCSIKLWRLSL